MRKSPVEAEPTVPRFLHSLEQEQQGMVLDWGKNRKNSADQQGETEAAERPDWHRSGLREGLGLYPGLTQNQTQFCCPGCSEGTKSGPTWCCGENFTGENSSTHGSTLERTQPLQWQKFSDFPCSLPKPLCISSVLCLFLEEHSGSGFPSRGSFSLLGQCTDFYPSSDCL